MGARKRCFALSSESPSSSPVPIPTLFLSSTRLCTSLDSLLIRLYRRSLDSFEWAGEYDTRFGCTYVDYNLKAQKPYPKYPAKFVSQASGTSPCSPAQRVADEQLAVVQRSVVSWALLQIIHDNMYHHVPSCNAALFGSVFRCRILQTHTGRSDIGSDHSNTSNRYTRKPCPRVQILTSPDDTVTSAC
jgi:hypothetical protein